MKPKSDPLLKALIEKLPKSDEDWPVDRQLAWFNLMAMAFGAVYGGDAAARLGIKVSADLAQAPAPKPAPPPKPEMKYPFIIDKNGYAKNGKTGKRVLPKDVTDMIADLRGIDGDMGTIIWADDSTGLDGADLMISAA